MYLFVLTFLLVLRSSRLIMNFTHSSSISLFKLSLTDASSLTFAAVLIFTRYANFLVNEKNWTGCARKRKCIIKRRIAANTSHAAKWKKSTIMINLNFFARKMDFFVENFNHCNCLKILGCFFARNTVATFE